MFFNFRVFFMFAFFSSCATKKSCIFSKDFKYNWHILIFLMLEKSSQSISTYTKLWRHPLLLHMIYFQYNALHRLYSSQISSLSLKNLLEVSICKLFLTAPPSALSPFIIYSATMTRRVLSMLSHDMEPSVTPIDFEILGWEKTLL